jgi:hypothetical protein
MFAWLTDATKNNWIFATTIISAVILVAGSGYALAKFIRHKFITRSGNAYNVTFGYGGYVKEEPQNIMLSIQAKTNISLGFICLSFEGDGDKPIIKGLYDLVSGRILNTPKPAYSIMGSTWFWKFEPPLQRPSVDLGLSVVANKQYNGTLRVDLSSDNPYRSVYDLPIIINEKQGHETYNGKGKYLGIVPFIKKRR